MPDDARVNEALADDIQKELLFKLKRLLGDLILRFQVVKVVLLALEIALIIASHIETVDVWVPLSRHTPRYRETVAADLRHLSHLLRPLSPLALFPVRWPVVPTSPHLSYA